MATATESKQSARSSKRNGATTEQDLVNEVENLKLEISAVMQTLSKIKEAGLGEVTSRSEQFKTEGLKRTQEVSDEVKAQLSEFEARAGETVRKYPLQSFGVALGVGFLAALLMRR